MINETMFAKVIGAVAGSTIYSIFKSKSLKDIFRQFSISFLGGVLLAPKVIQYFGFDGTQLDEVALASCMGSLVSFCFLKTIFSFDWEKIIKDKVNNKLNKHK